MGYNDLCRLYNERNYLECLRATWELTAILGGQNEMNLRDFDILRKYYYDKIHFGKMPQFGDLRQEEKSVMRDSIGFKIYEAKYKLDRQKEKILKMLSVN